MKDRTTAASPRIPARTRSATNADDRRRPATAKHQSAIATIEALFDRVDDLRVAHKRLTTIEPTGVDTDPIRDAETVVEAAQRLTDALANVRGAAERAAEHRSRGDLAADIGTRTTLLFPRPTTKPPPAASTPVRIAAPMTSETTIAAHEST